MDHQPLTIAGLHQKLVVQFLAELMTATTAVPTPEAFQHAAQAFCDALAPWLDPADGPARPRTVFPVLEDCTFDDEAERISVRFSPEGEALFGPGCAVTPCCSMLRCPVLLTHLSNNAARERVHVVWYRPCRFLPPTYSQPVSQLAFLPVVFCSVGPTLFSLPK